jgi:hypothetical protein
LGPGAAEGSAIPDITFYICGAIIGGAGGVLQSASRTMMCRHAPPARPTEAFGLYALSGKATAFLGPGADRPDHTPDRKRAVGHAAVDRPVRAGTGASDLGEPERGGDSDMKPAPHHPGHCPHTCRLHARRPALDPTISGMQARDFLRHGNPRFLG